MGEPVIGSGVGIQGSQDPMTSTVATGYLARDTRSDTMHRIAVSVLQGLCSDIRSIPSTSSGHVSGPMVVMMVDRAFSEFLRRVSETFYW